MTTPIPRRRTTRRRSRDEGGAIAVLWVLTLPLIMYGFTGLVYDGGRAINARAHAFDIADSAARAGATATDPTALAADNRLTLDPDEARWRAANYLDQTGHTGSITVDGDTVTVAVHTSWEPKLFAFAPGWTITATGHATATLAARVAP